MKIEHKRWQCGSWEPAVSGKLTAAQLVLLFGCPSLLKERYLLQEIQRAYPKAHLLRCSTAGKFSGTQLLHESLVATEIKFKHTAVNGVRIKLKKGMSDLQAGKLLAEEVGKEGLVNFLVLLCGVNVNES